MSSETWKTWPSEKILAMKPEYQRIIMECRISQDERNGVE